MPPRKTAAKTEAAMPIIWADGLKRYYRDMLLSRGLEEEGGELDGMGLFGGFCHH